MGLWGGRFKQGSSDMFRQVNDSLPFDQIMASQDIRGSVVWSRAICKAGVLTTEEQQKIESTLNTLLAKVNANDVDFSTSPEEDIHSFVEAYLIEQLGDLGRKLHMNVLQTRVEDVFVELTNRYGGLQSRYSVSKRFVKVKFSDFTRTTIEESLSLIDTQSKPEPWQNLEAFKRLARSAVERQSKAVRLIGLGVRLTPATSEASAQQLDLFTTLD